MYDATADEETMPDSLAGALVKIDDTPLGATEEGFSTDVTTVPDLTGRDRFLVARRVDDAAHPQAQTDVAAATAPRTTEVRD